MAESHDAIRASIEALHSGAALEGKGNVARQHTIVDKNGMSIGIIEVGSERLIIFIEPRANGFGP
jgi:hypothetical protein